MKILVSLLAVCVAAIAQPVDGPYTIWNSNGSTPVQYFHVVPESESSVHVFYQVGNDVYHGSVEFASGMWLDGPELLTPEIAGMTHHLYDAVATDSGWAAVVHQRDSEYNSISLYRESGYFSNVNSPVIQNHLIGEWPDLHEGAEFYGIAMAPQGNSIGILSQYHWSIYNNWPPNPWWEGGAGVIYVEEPYDSYNDQWIENGYFGSFGNGTPRSLLRFASPDSFIAVTGTTGESSIILSDGGLSVGSSFGSGLPQELCVTAQNRTLLLTSTHLLEIHGLDDYSELANVDLSPIAASASHPDYGMAWLSKAPGDLYLARADTIGSPVQAPGRLYEIEPGYVITDAALTILADGRIIAIWGERFNSSPNTQIIKIASVGWDTFLGTDNNVSPSVPQLYSLSAYPNPFNSEVKIQFSLPQTEDVSISAFDINGRLVETLSDQNFVAGDHELSWSPHAAAGMYFIRLSSASVSRTTKVLYLK